MENCENIIVVRDNEHHINDQDFKHVDPQETKFTAAESKSEEMTDTAEGGPNEENTEEEMTDTAEGGANEENTEEEMTKANDSVACQRGSKVTEDVNAVKKKDNDTEVEKKDGEVTEQPDLKEDNDSGVNEKGKESNNESYSKENDKANDIYVKEGKLEQKNKGNSQTNDSECQSQKTEEDRDTKDIKEIKDHVHDEQKNPARKGFTSFSATSASTKSSVCPRAVRPSARREAVAKFQKDQTPGVRNFKVQRTSIGMTGGASIKQKILQWCRSKTRTYEGVNIENFSSSWSDGLAFCALIHRFFPTAFDFSSLKASEREKNFSLAFNTAESLADCCPLLEVSDMLLMGKNPDAMCVFTYVQALCHHLSKIDKERKEKVEDKNKEEDCEVEGVQKQGEEEKDEKKDHNENQTDSGME